MTVQTFFQRHYSPLAGESPTGHAIAVLGGLVLMALGAVIALSLVLLPLGSVIGLVGLMVFGAGVFAHIQSPLKLRDLMDAIVTLTGAAIAGTFALAVLATAVGLMLTAFIAFFQWLGW
jgi:small-conductance mechanosensitive channel